MDIAVIVSLIAIVVSVASVLVARRSALAAERSADIQQTALDLEKNRHARERVKHAEERTPVWTEADDGEPGYFTWNGSLLEGILLNTGLSAAAIDLAVLDLPTGGRSQLETRVDPAGQVDGGWSSRPIIPPGAMMRVQCDMSQADATSPGRPSIYMDYTATGVAQSGPLGATIELLRTGEDAAGHPRWRIGDVKYAVRA